MFRRLIAWLCKPNKYRSDLFRCIDCGEMNIADDLNWGLCERCRWRAWKKEADDRMRSLSVRTPEREHCINCGLSVDPWCCCTRGRELASKIEANAISARDADFWDIANHEPEVGCVEYRFLDIPYEDEA